MLVEDSTWAKIAQARADNRRQRTMQRNALALCPRVEAVLLESADGGIHLAKAKPVIAARKPLFIDKPLASTFEDAREIHRLAKEADVPWFSSSTLRFGQIATTMKFA